MRRHLWLLGCSLAATACGGKVTSSDEPPLPPSHPTSERPTLVAGEASGALAVFAVDPATGAATRFGPSLPVDAGVIQVQEVVASADGTRAIVVLNPKSAAPELPTSVFAGDGTQWITLGSGSNGASLQSTADDLSLAVIYRECDESGSGGNLVSVVAFDGTHVIDEGSCRPAVRADTQFTFAPRGSFFVHRNAGGDTVVRERGGATHVVARGPNAPLPLAVFETSFVLWSPSGPTWFDASGAPLVIAGLPATYDVDRGYAVSDAGLWALDGKTARQTLRAPASGAWSASALRGVLTDSLVTLFDQGEIGATRARALDASGGTVATYPPPAAPSDPSQVATIVTFGGFGAEAGPAWLILDAQESPAITRPGANPSYRRAEDLWILRDGSGAIAPRVVRLRTAPASDPTASLAMRTYVASAGGAHALYAENGELHAVDTSTGTDAKLAVGFTTSDRSIASPPPR